MRASAGSGKTHNLVGEYLRAVVVNPLVYRNILAVTFTNKATEEMKERILRELHTLASGAPSRYTASLSSETGLTEAAIRANAAQARGNILHDFSRFHVMTIDRFFQSILRSFLRELGISPDFALELKTDTLLEKAADALIERSNQDEGLKTWIGEFVGERLDESAGWDVRAKLADAGKTVLSEGWDAAPTEERSLRDMLGEAVAQATAERDRVFEQIRAAAGEALAVMDEHYLDISDFSYGKNGISGFFLRTSQGRLEDYRAKSRVANARGSEDGTGWINKSSAARTRIMEALPALLEILERICALWDANRTLVNSVEVLRGRFRSYGLLEDISQEVERLCGEGNIIPIAQTNKILARLVAGNDAPFIFEKAGNHFSRFLIDEFQDTSHTQWGNFVPLLQNALAQSSGEPVLLVGDIKQSIYRWRGGDWRILSEQVPRLFGEAVEKPLATNFRSLRQVVEFNNRAIGECRTLDEATMAGILATAQADGYLSAEKAQALGAMLPAAYAAFEQQVRPGNDGGYVTVTMRSASKDDEGPDPVIGRVEELQRRGYRASQIAILVRRNAEAQQIARLLLDRKASQPGSPYCYDVVTAEALQVGSSPAVGFIIACLGMAADPEETLGRVVWNRHFGRPMHEPLPAEEEDFLRPLALCPPQEAFNKVLARYNVGTDQTAYVQALHEQLLRYCSNNVADLPLFLEWWHEKGATEAIWMPAGGNAISIITIHKAKGLEFPAVILPYCSWPLAPKGGSVMRASCENSPVSHLGSVDISHGDAASQSWFSEDYYTELTLAHVDNINLLYVALTRAERELHVCIPRRKAKAKENVTVGDLLTQAVTGMGGETTRDDERMQTIEFGQPAPPPQEIHKGEGPIPVDYLTREAGPRVKLRLPSSRYFEDAGGAPALSPRDYGMLMHRVFESADTVEQLREALASMRLGGELSPAEAGQLESMVSAALSDERIASWFDGSWQRVRNENDIIVPGLGTRRPDRVMVREGNAVVVDYKFGLRHDNAHKRQVEEYKKLLTSMGYTNIEGYLWYVSLGEVEEC